MALIILFLSIKPHRMCVHDNMFSPFAEQQKGNKSKELCFTFHGEGSKREYYEWFFANAFVNNNKINGYDNNILRHVVVLL
jgi:hypothetical protein